MMKNVRDYVNDSDILIEINCIGYKSEGEAIVIFLKDKEEIIWSGVIDCFKNGTNKTIEILSQNGYGDSKRKINFLCISHPDYDHIYGMDEIFENCTDEKTIFLTPNFLNDNYIPTAQTKEIIEYFKEKFSTMNETNYNTLFFDRCFEAGLKHEFLSRKTNKKINFSITALTPYNSITFSKNINRTQGISKNQYSMCLDIKLGDINVFLASDCEDEILSKIELDEVPDNIEYFKVPHHGSKTSTFILDNWLNCKNIRFGVCATRNKSNTTNDIIIKKYFDSLEEIHLTSSMDKLKNFENYGVVKFQEKYSELDGNFQHEGNALKYEFN